MNLLHLKYAVEVANSGSINKASNNLLIAQPNISRSIKELENDLGISIFKRSAKGMYLTSEGEEFIKYANKILAEVEHIESIGKNTLLNRQYFSVAVPRASYISSAFSSFSNVIGKEQAEFYYKEASAINAISSVLTSECNLGIIRYHEIYDNYFKSILKEKGLSFKLISDIDYVLVVNKNSSLAGLKDFSYAELEDFIEIMHMDLFVPGLSNTVKAETHDFKRKILINERASQFELLSVNDRTFMWASPIPQDILNRYGLVQKKSETVQKTYKDFLIYKNNYTFSDLDKKFLKELELSSAKNLHI